jgi:ribonuclease P protein component
MNQVRETFHKTERLCSRNTIISLFDEGNVFYTRLFKIVWFNSPVLIPHPAQVAFSVSKKGFRNAVTRNLLKRRLRESYRKNKSLLYDFLSSEKMQIIFIIIFRGNIVHDFNTLDDGIKELFKKLILVLREKKVKC